MSKFIIVLSITILNLTSYAANLEMNEDKNAAILKTAEAKSLNVYKALAEVKDVGLANAAKKTQILCTQTKAQEVSCTVSDNDEDMGWTVGLVIDWYVGNANKSEKMLYFLKAEKAEH